MGTWYRSFTFAGNFLIKHVLDFLRLISIFLLCFLYFFCSQLLNQILCARGGGQRRDRELGEGLRRESGKTIRDLYWEFDFFCLLHSNPKRPIALPGHGLSLQLQNVPQCNYYFPAEVMKHRFLAFRSCSKVFFISVKYQSRSYFEKCHAVPSFGLGIICTKATTALLHKTSTVVFTHHCYLEHSPSSVLQE